LNKKLFDILVCPFDKVSTLELIEFKTRSNSNTSNSQATPLNNEDAITKDGPDEGSINNINKEDNQVLPIRESVSAFEIIQEGLLLCKSCMRFYPITEEIPIILPDELRDKKKDMEFLNTWNQSIPKNLLKDLKPWTL
jgi:uncharacterized protein YbaR (Trm112 family)